MPALPDLLLAALDRRADLLARLGGESTDCYRLLHGIAEGAPGLTVDRYGPLLLLQTFRAPLPAADVERLRDRAATALGVDFAVVCNHRGPAAPADHPAHQPTPAALAEQRCRERSVRFLVRARHRGRDPWLFLDLRSGRAAVQQACAGKRVLNLFAYTCGVGVAAACAGAAEVVNVDFASSALAVGAANAAANGIACGDGKAFTLLHADCLPVLRQLAGQPVQRRGRHVPYARIERRAFDLIVLDPPRFARTPFGSIDVVRDYGSLFKPALLALAPGGAILATHHVPGIDADAWHAQLRRGAVKAGRPLRELQPIPVDADFPSFDGQPPLKVVLAHPAD